MLLMQLSLSHHSTYIILYYIILYLYYILFYSILFYSWISLGEIKTVANEKVIDKERVKSIKLIWNSLDHLFLE